MSDVANPFCSPAAIANSNYAASVQGRLVLQSGQPAAPLTAFVHDELRALVLNDHFSCLGAKAALRQGAYRFGLYDILGSEDVAAGVARDLFTFTHEIAAGDGQFTTFLASFSGPTSPDEESFERLLWRMLQQLHDLDAAHHGWDPSVADDPAASEFSFSFARTGFFIVGLHAASSRAARRFAWPTLVFNPHRQFDALRASGRYGRFQQVIRIAEQALQGGINPMLADHGVASEARQYSGRAVDSSWQCPFKPHGDTTSD
jgi:FPC/CPF motif-containing protein YcgG